MVRNEFGEVGLGGSGLDNRTFGAVDHHGDQGRQKYGKAPGHETSLATAYNGRWRTKTPCRVKGVQGKCNTVL